MTCPKCGTEQPEDVKGLCPKCLIEFAGRPDTLPFVSEFRGMPIVSVIGRGGMGVVLRLRQPQLNRDVAVKLLPKSLAEDPAFLERFNREAQTLAKLSHANVVAVYDFGVEQGYTFLVMEYVDGVNLRQVLQQGKLKPEEALKIVPQLCDALQYAHDQGVVHRDIKPENILIDRAGRVKIADFGIAKLAGRSGLTEAKSVMGTPHYMAPEQIENPKAVDHRADIYSMGVVFYEMLTGELPIGKFEPPSRRVSLDVRFDEVVLRTLEKEPERRYQTAVEVKNDVTRIQPSTPPQPVSKWVSALLAALLGLTLFFCVRMVTGAWSVDAIPYALCGVLILGVYGWFMAPQMARARPVAAVLGVGAILAIGMSVFVSLKGASSMPYGPLSTFALAAGGLGLSSLWLRRGRAWWLLLFAGAFCVLSTTAPLLGGLAMAELGRGGPNFDTTYARLQSLGPMSLKTDFESRRQACNLHAHGQVQPQDVPRLILGDAPFSKNALPAKVRVWEMPGPDRKTALRLMVDQDGRSSPQVSWVYETETLLVEVWGEPNSEAELSDWHKLVLKIANAFDTAYAIPPAGLDIDALFLTEADLPNDCKFSSEPMRRVMRDGKQVFGTVESMGFGKAYKAQVQAGGGSVEVGGLWKRREDYRKGENLLGWLYRSYGRERVHQKGRLSVSIRELDNIEGRIAAEDLERRFKARLKE